MGAQFHDRVGGIRKRIGLVVDSFDATYQATFVRHLKAACEQRRLELIVFPGGHLASGLRAAAHRNPLYDLITDDPLDGVVVLGSTINAEVGPEGLARFCANFASLPLCCVGARVPGVPSVTINNASGMRRLIDHLVEEHQFQRIAFIRGPSANQEAEARFGAYREAIEAHGIAFDEAYTAQGDFLPETGHDAINEFLAERRLQFEAVVAANDYMAIGAMEALTAHPMRPTRSVAIAGFDNVDEANFTSPALTTVEQPLKRMAEAAVRCILDQLQGAAVQPELIFDAQPLIRRSCGCLGGGREAYRLERPRADGSSYELHFARRREQIIAELSRASRGGIVGLARWETTLLDAFLDELRGVPGDVFFLALEGMLGKVGRDEGEVWRFHTVLSELRKQALSCLTNDRSRLAQAEDIFQVARTYVGDALVRVQAQLRLSIERLERQLNECGTNLTECSDARTLKQALSKELPRLGLKRAYLVVFEGESTEMHTRHARLFFSLDVTDHQNQQAQSSFAAVHLLPDEVWLRGEPINWVLLPLFFRGRALGYAMLHLMSHNGSYFEMLRSHLSVALWSVLFGPSLMQVHSDGPERLPLRPAETEFVGNR